jgi:hypothetical protein
MDPSDREHDLYFSRDFPVLAAIARWEAAGRANRYLRAETIAEEVERPVEEVIQSLGRLFHASLVDAAELSSHDGEDYMVKRLTRAGLEESGLWPKPANLAIALREALEREVQATARTDPGRSQKMKMILDELGDLGTTFAAKLAAELLKILSGGH